MYKLSVPLEAQRKSSTCWHASALMIWRYSQITSGRAGPMYSLSEKWGRNETISPQEFISLAKNVGLVELPLANIHTTSSLEAWLKTHGPIWCAGFWYGPGHIIVLTGVDTGIVLLNDPDGGKPKLGTIAWFNQNLSSKISGCMMVKDSKRY